MISRQNIVRKFIELIKHQGQLFEIRTGDDGTLCPVKYRPMTIKNVNRTLHAGRYLNRRNVTSSFRHYTNHHLLIAVLFQISRMEEEEEEEKKTFLSNTFKVPPFYFSFKILTKTFIHSTESIR